MKRQSTVEKQKTRMKRAGARPDEVHDEGVLANPDMLPAPPERVPSDEFLAVLALIDRGGLKALTLAERQAFDLVINDGLSYAEAAKVLQVNNRTVYDAIQRAAVKIRKITPTIVTFPGL
jgi:DNA-directed RNA polymerase specialized sigma24 family protein